MTAYTVHEAAARLGLAARTVRRWCLVLGMAKLGPAYLLEESDIVRIAEHAQDGPGRPRRDV